MQAEMHANSYKLLTKHLQDIDMYLYLSITQKNL